MHKKRQTAPLLVSIVIPTFNNENDLSVCLQSIKRQKYPQNKIEILLCDGGSTDKTKSIAKKFGCRIIENKKRLAEFGVALGLLHAKGDVITILAADNELESEAYLSLMIYPFVKDKNIMLTYPIHVSSKRESWIAEYINTFTDPINHFVYGNASNTRTFFKEYQIKEKTKEYMIFHFSVENYPMLAFAQGTTVRKSFQRKKDSFGDDLAPVVDMIKRKYDLAYVPQAKLIHHTTRTLGEFIRKQRWAIDNYLVGKNYGIRVRQQLFSQKRNWRKVLWPVYACSIVLPIVFAIKGLLTEKQHAWIYHPFLTYTVFLILVFEYIRVRIFRVTSVTQRKKV
jgi:glycosyltransferase involved in cell wall biosynthesis